MNESAAQGSRRPFSDDPGRDRLYRLHFSAAFAAAVVLLFILGPGSAAIKRNFEGIKPGLIADRDIKAGKDVVYVDTEATRLRVDAEERLVLPVFQLDSGIASRTLSQFKDFSTSFRELMAQDIALDTAILMLQSKFPGSLSRDTLSLLGKSSLKSQALVYSEDILGSILAEGVFSLPTEGLARFNQDYFELGRVVNGKTEYEQRLRSSMKTEKDVGEAINTEVEKKHLARPLSTIVYGLVSAFVSENAFFDETMSLSRLKKVSGKIEPVTRTVGKNELLLRKGEMVSDESYARILAIRSAVSRADIGLSLRGGNLLASHRSGSFSFRRRKAGGGR